MQEKRRALGKGLEQLFSNEAFNIDELERNIIESSNKEDVKLLNLSELRSNPYQPRKVFDDEKLEELATSIKEYGVIEPIIVKRSIKGYEIVAGERRTLAARKAGLEKIPAIIRDFTDEEMLEIAILENIQREDLNIIEEAEAYKKMLETLHLTHDELSKKIGKSRSYLTNILGLLQLPSKIQKLILDDKLSMGHARILSKLSDVEKVFDLTQRVVDENLSVRELENIVNENYVRKNPIAKPKAKVNPNYQYVQDILRDKIGTMVKVNNKNITIPFDSEKDLERILKILDIKVEID